MLMGPQQNLLNAPGTATVPLVAVSVRIPREAMQHRGRVLYFGIDVIPLDGATGWRVFKRYTDLANLNAQLSTSQGPRNPRLTAVASHLSPSKPFPRKHLTGCQGVQLEERRAKLEIWLMSAMRHNNGYWTGYLQNSLECWRHQPLLTANTAIAANPTMTALTNLARTPSLAATTPATSNALVSRPQASLATPAMPAQPAVAPQTDLKGTSEVQMSANPCTPSVQRPCETMEVEIPAGILAGQMLGVTVPDGREATIRIPEGSEPGSTLLLSFDPASGTLSRLQPVAVEAERRPSVAESSDPRSGSQLVSVQVPTGVKAGQLLGVMVPDGRQINVTVPHGAAEGSTLQCCFDSKEGTLAIMQ